MISSICRTLGIATREDIAQIYMHLSNINAKRDQDGHATQSCSNLQPPEDQNVRDRLSDSIKEVEKKYRLVEGSWSDHNGAPTFTNMELESGRLLHSLVALQRPKVVIETGTHQGYSAALMAQAMSNYKIDGHIWTIDPFVVSHLFENNDLQRYVTWISDYSTSLEKFNLPEHFDMLVLDSDHTYDTLSLEVNLFEPRLKVGGLLIFHDTVVFKDLWPVIQSIKSSGRFELITLDTPRNWCRDDMNGSGLTICRKTAPGDPIAVNESFKSNQKIDDFIKDLCDFDREKASRSVFFKTT